MDSGGTTRSFTVVGTGQATKRIRTGQRVRVDGDRGVVTILD
jgi:pyruvate, water dikinase